MDTRTQAALWAFVTAYKAHTGEKLSYVRLVQEPTYLRRALRRAAGLRDAELRRLSGELQPLLDRLAAAAEQYSVRQDTAAGAPASDAEGELEQNYRNLLEEALLRAAPIHFSDREELDALGRRHRLDAAATRSLEDNLRRDLGHPPLRWSDELRTNVRRLHEANRLDERRRIQLYDIYIKRGRLSVTHAEEIMEQERPVQAATGAETRHLGRLPWAVGAAVGTLVAGLAAFGWLQTAPLEAASEGGRVKPITVTGPISRDTTWKTNGVYRLGDVVFVEAGATLTIEPGATIRGDYGSALVVARDARLHARGRRDNPVVFTSNQLPGQRLSGDWGGIVLLGRAPVNRPDARVEGLADDDPRARFGGSDGDHSCGVLEFVRVEFAGHALSANNELNGLTLGGCGSDTIVRNIQVHRPLDDGIELFGGSVDLRNTVVTGPGDDGLDWDLGWHGRAQRLIVQMYAEQGDNAIEADNNRDEPNAMPRSAPTLYNLTLLGPGDTGTQQRGMTLRRGTAATIHNLLLAGFPLEAVDVQGTVSAALAGAGKLHIGPAALLAPAGGRLFSSETGDGNDDGGFDEASWLADAAATRSGRLALPSQAFDDTQPRFAPLTDAVVDGGTAAPQSEFWDESATFLGAVRPGQTRSWLAGWTAFPAN